MVVLSFFIRIVGSVLPLAGVILVSITLAFVGGSPGQSEGLGTIRFSDSFDRANADGCGLGHADNALGGSESHYYIPIFANGAGIDSNTLRNDLQDLGGVQFSAGANCSQLGEDVGADLNIRSDLLVPTDGAGHISEAGPYIRSRFAAKSDGIIGGSPSDPSGGYWIELRSTGEVKVKNLRSNTVVAGSGQPVSFDTTVFHTIEVAAQGTSLQVSLDGHLLAFCGSGSSATTVPILTDTNLPGDAIPGNDGTAGIAFAAEANRGLIGGQRADNLVVSAYSALDGLPVQDSCGAVSGRIVGPPPGQPDSEPAPLDGAVVTICGNPCATTTTNSLGQFFVTGLGPGDYHVIAYPPADRSDLLPGDKSITLSEAQSLDVGDLTQVIPSPVPAAVTITGIGMVAGVPVISWDKVTPFSKSACTGGSASFQLIAANGTSLESGPMAETSPGVYGASLSLLFPYHGAATVKVHIHCPDATDDDESFSVYVDPSGYVRTVGGAPISGATVTLYRANSAAGPFSVVENGSAVMSPANRNNPDTTNSDGRFGWDVVGGYYKVRAEKSGCVSPDHADQAYVETQVLQIPPPVTDLELRLACGSQQSYARGDVNCSGTIDAMDALTVLRAAAGLPANQPSGCPEPGAQPAGVAAAVTAAAYPWGDVNCSGATDAGDALQLLLYAADLTVILPPGCPPMNST